MIGSALGISAYVLLTRMQVVETRILSQRDLNCSRRQGHPYPATLKR